MDEHEVQETVSPLTIDELREAQLEDNECKNIREDWETERRSYSNIVPPEMSNSRLISYFSRVLVFRDSSADRDEIRTTLFLSVSRTRRCS